LSIYIVTWDVQLIISYKEKKIYDVLCDQLGLNAIKSPKERKKCKKINKSNL